MASVRKRTIPTERPPLVSEVSANRYTLWAECGGLRLLGSLSVASYDLQGLRWKYSYPPPQGEGVQIRLQSTHCQNCRVPSSKTPISDQHTGQPCLYTLWQGGIATGSIIQFVPHLFHKFSRVCSDFLSSIQSSLRPSIAFMNLLSCHHNVTAKTSFFLEYQNYSRVRIQL
jgi:hypothetical protein